MRLILKEWKVSDFIVLQPVDKMDLVIFNHFIDSSKIGILKNDNKETIDALISLCVLHNIQFKIIKLNGEIKNIHMYLLEVKHG